ncbi:MAG: hypothetical protein CM15mV9_0020 [uncultured marine virus]|nr:MAG: hypothetical protein CM15mV9_0020 [uncultured marine virus]
MKSLLFKIGVGVSLGINLFMFAALLYNINRYDKRVDENRKWLKEAIVEEVYNQIKFVMPKESGGVYVPNK